MTKDKQIIQLTNERDEAYKRIEELEKALNEGFHESREYKRMQEEIHNLELVSKVQFQHVETEIRSDMEFTRHVKQILADNIELCKKHGINYWEGIAQKDRYAHKDFRELERENEKLRARVAALEEILKHLQAVLSAQEELPAQIRGKGRPAIDEKQKKRIMKLRKDGWTIKDIALKEGVSVGSVSKIINSPEKSKKQPKEVGLPTGE